jgi:XTP/dITP diphosphohydrolase
MKLYFVTSNEGKVKDLRAHFADAGIEIEHAPYEIQEVLNLDLDEMVRQKTLSAYRYLSRPCVVEHGGLFITALKELPGGLTKEMWERLGGQICEMVGPDGDRSAVARSIVGHCDGRRINLYRGETRGSLAPRPAGSGGYSWDPIFVPEGCEKTFAEMSFAEKVEHSQTMKAWTMLRDGALKT